MRLLLDENLSPVVALELQGLGYDVIHVRDRGALGREDDDLFALAFKEDRVFVTINAKHFRRLAENAEVHCGLIVLELADLSRAGQKDAILRAVTSSELQDFINHVVTVDASGKLHIERIPADD